MRSGRPQIRQPSSGHRRAGAGKPSAAAPVRTLAKALTILETVSVTGGLSVAEIASAVGLNRTTTHRLVQALMSAGYLKLAENGTGYEIGLKVLPLAAKQLDSNRLRLATLPYLNELGQQTGERADLGILFDGELLYLAGVEKPSLPNVYSRFGGLAPVHCSALGKAIIAFLPEDEQRALIEQRPLVQCTPNTIIDPDRLMAELADIRQRAYATDDQEHVANVWCLAAPILNASRRPVAAIGVSGGDRSKIFGLAAKVLLSAEIVSHILLPTQSG